MKEFDVRTRVYYGENALDRIKQLPYKKVMVIADPFVVKSGLYKHVTNRLKQAEILYEVYDNVVPDPPIQKVAEGIAEALRFRPDAIIAIGGGSAIDTSKAIKRLGRNNDETFLPKLIAIPTTSGTGSEVTSISVVTDPEVGTKYPLSSQNMIPDEAILDDVLVKSVPAGITAATGMDVLTHAVEASVSSQTNEFSSAMAEKAIEIVGEFLLRSWADNNDTRARRKMHVASCLAGLAFNASGLGLNHGMAHQLGAEFHIPHGVANSILLPYIIEFNSEITLYSHQKESYNPCVRRYCNIARILGVFNLNEVVTIRSLISYVRFLAGQMKLPDSVHKACPDLTEEEYLSKVTSMAEHAIQDDTVSTNPRVPTVDDVIEIYKAIW